MKKIVTCVQNITCVKKCYTCYTCEKKGYIYEKHEKSCDMCEKKLSHINLINGDNIDDI